jgi:folate-binding protein YgfZ
MAVAHSEVGFAARLADDRFDIFVQPEAAAGVWERLSGQARPVGAGAWAWLMVNSGIPTILPETQDAFVPQMANMGALNGLSLTKGCYPGQEIVARTQYLGQQKRRMYLAHVEGSAHVGETLYSPNFGEQAAGMVVNAAPAPGSGTDLLAVLLISAFEGGEVHLASPDGPPLGFKRLPYEL